MLFSSCNDWLDVKPQGQTEEEDMYTSYEGFKNALIGCYMKMKSRNLYGEKLTMSHVESLAQLWDLSASTRQADVALSQYDFEDTYAKSAISTMYGSLYNVVAQANSILEHLESNGDYIEDETAFKIIKGEAHAIRALCHFDILRLFGQMPQNAVKSVKLPYAEVVSIKDLPAYYDYSTFCRKLENDLLAAEQNLANVDPVTWATMTYSGNEDKFLDYRGLRLNYFAVKALQARYYLYTNQTDKAYTAAKTVYTAEPVGLSTVDDFNLGYFAAPSECLFALSNQELMDYEISVLGMGSDLIKSTHLFITTEMHNALYDGVDIATHIGYGSMWNTSTMDGTGDYTKALLKKYYYNTKSEYSASALLTKLQIIPMIRMSEIYLILMETTTDLDEANTLYSEYMRARSVNVSETFASLDEVKDFVVGEIRREFYAEGHMFYTYKRLGISRMLWGATEVGEDQYILPLPDSEFDPAVK